MKSCFGNTDLTVVPVRGSINSTDIFSSGALIDSLLYKFKLLFLLSLSPESYKCHQGKDKGELLPKPFLIIALYCYF